MITVVIKLPCTQGSEPDRSAHTVGILGWPVLYFYGDFISGSSGTSVGGKGLRHVSVKRSEVLSGGCSCESSCSSSCESSCSSSCESSCSSSCESSCSSSCESSCSSSCESSCSSSC